MKLTEEEFDAAGKVLANTLHLFNVPEKEKMKCSARLQKSLVEQLNNRKKGDSLLQSINEPPLYILTYTFFKI